MSLSIRFLLKLLASPWQCHLRKINVEIYIDQTTLFLYNCGSTTRSLSVWRIFGDLPNRSKLRPLDSTTSFNKIFATGDGCLFDKLRLRLCNFSNDKCCWQNEGGTIPSVRCRVPQQIVESKVDHIPNDLIKWFKS